MLKKQLIVTIDGPSGVGKSTLSRKVAKELGYTYLDTGAMYRAVGLHVKLKGADKSSEKDLAAAMSDIQIELFPASGNGDVGVVLNGRDVSDIIRTPEMSMVASRVSALAVVREKLTNMQRIIGSKGRIVAEGRDTGTVVFPDAAYKFYLDANPEERARRRVVQLEKGGARSDQKKILAMILERDKADSQRSLAPLKKADDAHLIDTTCLNIEEVADRILKEISKKYVQSTP
ncbi:MAG: (d)CMP kinase [Bacteroidetes bacterium]|nr:(d)CMP kinase [Bacteroidota bacterium]